MHPSAMNPPAMHPSALHPSAMHLSGIGQARGFTLLEILIALSLTAMLLTMLTAGIYGVVRDWDDNAKALEDTLDQTVTLLQLERALQGAFPHSYRDTETLAQHVYFVGEPDALSWVSTVSPQRDSGLMAWQLQAGREGVSLRLAPALSDHPGQRLQDASPVLILEGHALEIQYLYEDLDFQRRWRVEWDGMQLQSLPMAVHLRLTPNGRADNRRAGSRLPSPIDIVAPILTTQHRSIQPTQELLN